MLIFYIDIKIIKSFFYIIIIIVWSFFFILLNNFISLPLFFKDFIIKNSLIYNILIFQNDLRIVKRINKEIKRRSLIKKLDYLYKFY